MKAERREPCMQTIELTSLPDGAVLGHSPANALNWERAYAVRDSLQAESLANGLNLNQCRYALRVKGE